MLGVFNLKQLCFFEFRYLLTNILLILYFDVGFLLILLTQPGCLL